MNEKQTTTKVLNGLFWKLMENGGAQGVQFLVSIILARLLSPEEYGVRSWHLWDLQEKERRR